MFSDISNSVRGSITPSPAYPLMSLSSARMSPIVALRIVGLVTTREADAVEVRLLTMHRLGGESQEPRSDLFAGQKLPDNSRHRARRDGHVMHTLAEGRDRCLQLGLHSAGGDLITN